ncbi:TRAP transporter small permease subunit [Shewanella litorisediminis]|uniref:TRAP transporter small permease protein n=1 Tax=Shewanella litorisediminis TaxID=1173586 RepID=A0ABX7G0I7_9GAMM|nr:TRAP transporter small permease subunit [Shewanella litorisediminis]MCL2918115.1 TRAP transporter small permease subunit [Shewanella litorisediminis]QRH00827.1 TRAP transporter small permease subunit [Shewanella litorisediminis]
MGKLIGFLDGITEAVGRLVGWFTLGMVLMTLAVVVLRYAFATGATALQETALYLHGAVFTLAAGFTLKRDAHVRVDVFYRQCSERTRHWIDFVGTLLFLFPLSLAIGIYCFDYVINAWRIGESSAEAGGLPWVYLQKSLLLGLCASLILQGLCDLYRHGKALFGREAC